MGEAVANIACDMLVMSLSEVSDEAIGGRNAWFGGRGETLCDAPWVKRRMEVSECVAARA